jgi:probable HAF family extracellular repeat protein
MTFRTKEILMRLQFLSLSGSILALLIVWSTPASAEIWRITDLSELTSDICYDFTPRCCPSDDCAGGDCHAFDAYDEFFATAVNDAGDIAGRARNSDGAKPLAYIANVQRTRQIWSGTAGGRNINAIGRICGQGWPHGTPYIWGNCGVDQLSKGEIAGWFYLMAINDQNNVAAGYYYLDDDPDQLKHPVAWIKTSSWSASQPIVLSGGSGRPLAAINDGTLAGYLQTGDNAYIPVLWHRNGDTYDEHTALPTLGASGLVVDMNNDGIAVGWSRTNDDQATYAVMWDNGEIVDLGLGVASNALGISSEGTITGIYRDSNDGLYWPFVWSEGSITLLRDRIVGGLSFAGIQANDINSSGVIAAQARDLDGLWHALMLTADSCPADVDDSGDVGVQDLLAVLGAWGPCALCPEDVDGDGEVGVGDLLLLLSNWGPCP